MVADWIDSLRAPGPPAEGVSVWEDDELYLAAVPRTLLVCRYFVVVYERLIVLDHFDPALHGSPSTAQLLQNRPTTHT
jgi:hypothetical protein